MSTPSIVAPRSQAEPRWRAAGEEVFLEEPDLFACSDLGNVFPFSAGVYDLQLFADFVDAETLGVHGLGAPVELELGG